MRRRRDEDDEALEGYEEFPDNWRSDSNKKARRFNFVDVKATDRKRSRSRYFNLIFDSGEEEGEEDDFITAGAKLQEGDEEGQTPLLWEEDQDYEEAFERRMQDSLVGATVKIRIGPYKGYRGRVKDVDGDSVRVELDSQIKVITVTRDQISTNLVVSTQFCKKPTPGSSRPRTPVSNYTQAETNEEAMEEENLDEEEEDYERENSPASQSYVPSTPGNDDLDAMDPTDYLLSTHGRDDFDTY